LGKKPRKGVKALNEAKSETPELELFRKDYPLDDPGDLRIGHVLGKKVGASSPSVVIVGFPSDEGVRRNGGRVGASKAPSTIRKHFYRLTADLGFDPHFKRLIQNSLDVGDVKVSGNLERDQVELARMIAEYLKKGIAVAVLGGGHETSYGHFLGYVDAMKPVEILNWDAHADVRPLKKGLGHSGSPFRQALGHPSGLCRSYRVVGLQRHSNASSHLDFISGHDGSYLFKDETNREQFAGFGSSTDMALLLTVDMDVVDQSFAPGVSAPAAGGISQDWLLDLAFAAGRSPSVTSFDLVEVNPDVDRDEITCRLAAVTIWNFLRGVSQRGLDPRSRPSSTT
jgi:formiminoglutamase